MHIAATLPFTIDVQFWCLQASTRIVPILLMKTEWISSFPCPLKVDDKHIHKVWDAVALICVRSLKKLFLLAFLKEES